MKKLYKEFNKKGIQDDGGVKSKEFISFARKFKNALKRTFPDFEIRNYSIGHYEISGFLEKDQNFIYFSYDVPRRCHPMDMDRADCCAGVLIRWAKNAEDYHGEQNHFCSILQMREAVDALYKRKEVKL